MYNLLLNIFNSKTNYKYINMPNVFNFIISMLENKNNDDRKIIIDKIKINMGMTFYNEFQQYYIKKVDKPLN